MGRRGTTSRSNPEVVPVNETLQEERREEGSKVMPVKTVLKKKGRTNSEHKS